jgi:hypothetical protein
MQMVSTAAALLTSMALACAQQPGDEPDKVPSDFVRFVPVGDGGHLDTAITTYKKGDVEVILFGAVHIADSACYDTLNDRFTACDALLYELVGPEDYRPTKDREQGFNPLAMLQQGLKNSLELEFQLDGIDYLPTNFVHADMTPQEFEDSMAERGESLLTIMLDMMFSGMEMQREKAENGEAQPAQSFDLVKAFRNREGRHMLRMAFAAQLEEVEALAAGGKDGTLLVGRNKKCLKVLEREIAAGRKKIGIFYGAAHLGDMEQRLVGEMGFTKVAHEWIVAWDCAKRPDRTYDRALVKLRQRCKQELATLATAARDYRRAVEPAAVATVQDLAAEREGGARSYAGPLQDPWGHDYLVRKRPTGTRWEAWSLGQDGAPGTDDDMVAQEPRGR